MGMKEMLICKIISKTLITMLTTLRKFISDWHGTILSTMLVLAACSSCERLDDSSKLESSRTITLKYKVAPMDVSTYANPSADEVKVNSLLVLFFNAGGGKYVGYTTTTGTGPLSGVTMSGLSEVSLPLPSMVNSNSYYDVIVVANYNYYNSPYGGPVENYISTIAEDKTALDVANTLYFRMNSGILSYKILMSGYANSILAEDISVVLERSVAKVDVINNESNFVIESLKVYNAALKVSPLSNVQFDPTTNRVNLTSSTHLFSNNILSRKVYVFPSSVAECKQNDKQTTCLIIKGRYKGEEASFYRVNLVFKGANQLLEKNKFYILRINSVFGSGFNTEEKAYTSSDGKISYSLTSDWENTNDYNPATVTNGTSSIWVSNRKVSLSFEKDVSDDITIVATGGSVAVTENLGWLDVTSSDNITYTLKTNSANTATDRTGTVTFTVGGLSLAVNVTQRAILPSEKSLTVNDGTASVDGGDVTIPVTTSGNGIDFSHSALTGPSGWTITKSGSDIVVNTDAQPDNAPTTAREASFTVNSAGLSKTVKVYQPARPATIALSDGTSTTPFSNEGESRTYTFTCSYGNLSSAGIDIMVSNSGFSVDLSGNTVTVTATTKQEIFGAPKRSALITVAAQNGATYSFMVEQEEVAIASNSEVVQVGGSGIYWDNRNLGATSSLFFTNQNPTAIGTNADAKGAYNTIITDPCPGFGPNKKLPSLADLLNLLTNIKSDITKGYRVYYADGVTRAGAKKRIFFPLAGYDDGTLDNKNRTPIGYYWSSSVLAGSNNFFLQLGSDGINNNVATSQSNTTKYSVRCVEETVVP